MTSERIRPLPSGRRSTTAAAVSSQLVSMPRTIIVYLYVSGTVLYDAIGRGAAAARIALTPRTRPLQSAQIRIGTRGSPLALAQAEEVKRRLIAAHRLLPVAGGPVTVISA